MALDRDDHKALAAGAIRLINDNEFALKVVRNAHESTRKFTWPYIRDQWLDLYRELADEKGFLTSTSDRHVPMAETDSAL